MCQNKLSFLEPGTERRGRTDGETKHAHWPKDLPSISLLKPHSTGSTTLREIKPLHMDRRLVQAVALAEGFPFRFLVHV